MAFKKHLLAATITLVSSFFAIAGATQAGDADVPPATPHVDPQQLINALPSATRWLYHIDHELMRFWRMPQALGKAGGYSYGDFPTLRCNDGTLFVNKDGSQANVCLEQVDPVPNIVWQDRDFVRAKSRQVFAYGIAFHMTGNTEYLEYMKAGVKNLRDHYLDREHGGAYSYQILSTGEMAPAVKERRSQDLSYALSGLGFYYYLTRDENVLMDIIAVRDFIFDAYFDRDWKMLRWVNESSPDGDTLNQKELVAQLDQVYAYGLWLTPALPEAERKKWWSALSQLARMMIEQYYTPREGMFWGAIHDPAHKRLGTDHTDFGHSVKAMWLIYTIGKWTDDIALIEWGRTNAARILERAFNPETGAWGIKRNPDGTLDTDKEWWALCELDQVASTLALIDPAYARYLPTTYDDYLTNMVDHEHGGVFHLVDGDTLKPNIRFPKQHSWKNSLHSTEHALVAYMTTLQLRGKEIPLYYAFNVTMDDASVTPYFYHAKKQSIEPVGQGLVKVTFSDLH
jgi:mannose/cellobiose epimerase-like protein (N-acyl-D-glucosamine 2-epimerase family)